MIKTCYEARMHFYLLHKCNQKNGKVSTIHYDHENLPGKG